MSFGATKRIIRVIVMLVIILRHCNGLSMNYYMVSCPKAELIVRNTVTSAFRTDPTLAAGLLRMHFHDCFVEGCDASILLDSTSNNKAEKDSIVSLSLRGYEVIDDAKEQLEKQCPGVVSCVDIVAMAARDAVLFTAPSLVYDIPKGRKDGTRSKIEDTIKLPPSFYNSSELIKVFGQKGFTAQEMVALSGGHTLGVAHCSTFKYRLKNFDSTHDVDPSMDTRFMKTLTKRCSTRFNVEQPFDATRHMFDNAYYRALQSKAGLLTSDQTLMTDPKTRPIVNAYAMNQSMFFFDFQRAMVKMGMLDVKKTGQVRQNCRKIN